MAGAGIRIEVDDREAQVALSRVLAAGLDLKPLFDRLGKSLVTSTTHRFETETGPDGRKWKPLSRRTIKRKKGSTRILVERGLLLASITHNAAPDYLEVGTGRRYGAIHQFGGTIDIFARSQIATFARNREGNLRFVKKRSARKRAFARPVTIGAHTITIPARPYLGLDEADRTMIVETAEAYLAEAQDGGAA